MKVKKLFNVSFSFLLICIITIFTSFSTYANTSSTFESDNEVKKRVEENIKAVNDYFSENEVIVEYGSTENIEIIAPNGDILSVNISIEPLDLEEELNEANSFDSDKYVNVSRGTWALHFDVNNLSGRTGSIRHTIVINVSNIVNGWVSFKATSARIQPIPVQSFSIDGYDAYLTIDNDSYSVSQGYVTMASSANSLIKLNYYTTVTVMPGVTTGADNGNTVLVSARLRV